MMEVRMYVKILCDDNYDPDLTYQIDGETVNSSDDDTCEQCEYYAECMGFAKVFNRCGR